MRPGEERFREVFDRVEPYVERRWNVAVRIRDVPSPFTGDLDGAEIHIDHDLHAEDAVFNLVHLFGHTVQWNVSARAREIGSVLHQRPSEALLAELARYEEEACRYSLQLFHDAGVRDLDQWLADFAACDAAYLDRFYRTGEKRPFRSFWKDGMPLLTPLAIPAFTPTRWVSRWEGIVV